MKRKRKKQNKKNNSRAKILKKRANSSKLTELKIKNRHNLQMSKLNLKVLLNLKIMKIFSQIRIKSNKIANLKKNKKKLLIKMRRSNKKK